MPPSLKAPRRSLRQTRTCSTPGCILPHQHAETSISELVSSCARRAALATPPPGALLDMPSAGGASWLLELPPDLFAAIADRLSVHALYTLSCSSRAAAMCIATHCGRVLFARAKPRPTDVDIRPWPFLVVFGRQRGDEESGIRVTLHYRFAPPGSALAEEDAGPRLMLATDVVLEQMRRDFAQAIELVRGAPGWSADYITRCERALEAAKPNCDETTPVNGERFTRDDFRRQFELKAMRVAASCAQAPPSSVPRPASLKAHQVAHAALRTILKPSAILLIRDLAVRQSNGRQSNGRRHPTNPSYPISTLNTVYDRVYRCGLMNTAAAQAFSTPRSKTNGEHYRWAQSWADVLQTAAARVENTNRTLIHLSDVGVADSGRLTRRDAGKLCDPGKRQALTPGARHNGSVRLQKPDAPAGSWEHDAIDMYAYVPEPFRDALIEGLFDA